MVILLNNPQIIPAVVLSNNGTNVFVQYWYLFATIPIALGISLCCAIVIITLLVMVIYKKCTGKPTRLEAYYERLIDGGKYKDKRQIDKIMKEVLSSEITYVSDLQTLKTCYIEKILEQVKKEKRKSSNKITLKLNLRSQLVNPKLIPFFGQVDMILNINEIFLKKIKKIIRLRRRNNYKRINKFSAVVVEFATAFRLYSTYISQYHAFEALFNKEMKRKRFKKFVKDIENELKEKKHRICGFLDLAITPIQRIPRIRLFVEGLLKNLEQGFVEYENIEKAQKIVVEVANFVNSKTKEIRKFKRMKELIKTLGKNSPIMKNSGRLVRDGTVFRFRKSKFKKEIECNIILSNKYLVIWNKKKPLDHTMFKKPYDIRILNKKTRISSVGTDRIIIKFMDEQSLKLKSITIRFESSKERNSWFEEIENEKSKSNKEFGKKLLEKIESSVANEEEDMEEEVETKSNWKRKSLNLKNLFKKK